jgi:hypothetical protein
MNSTNAKRSNTASRETDRSSAHAMRSSRGQADTSQNSEIDHLNAQSLQAAQQGHPFDVGSAGGSSNSGSMNSGSMKRSGMSGGNMNSGSGSVTGNGSGSMPGSGSSNGSGHM